MIADVPGIEQGWVTFFPQIFILFLFIYLFIYLGEGGVGEGQSKMTLRNFEILNWSTLFSPPAS